MVSLHLRLLWKPSKGEDGREREEIQEHKADLHLLCVNRSTGREKEKILKETEVGAKEEKKADQGVRKVPGKCE